MGTIVFYICFWLLLITLVLSGYLRSRKQKEKRKEFLKRSFSDPDKSFMRPGHTTEPALYEHFVKSHPDRFSIDGITANDLGISDIFASMNHCVTCAGEDMLYCTLRTDTGADGEKSVYDEAMSLSSSPEKAYSLLEILDRIPRYKDTDEFLILKRLPDADDSGTAVDIAVIAALIISVIMTAFYPVPGFIAVLIMICIGIATYFSGRNRMLEHLEGVSLSLRLIRCARNLSVAGREEFTKYEPLLPLCFGNSLISYKDGTSSDPLSLVLDYVRMITHIDIIIYRHKIAGIKEKIGEILMLYRDIGRLDMCLALASYLNGRNCCASEVSDDRIIEAKGLYHPLIRVPVCNDIEASRSVLLTGSNASGKSTFLKAVGLNVIFSENFGFAFAQSFKTGAFKVYTSMAVRDDIHSGESYYVVEARSIKRLTDAASDLSLCIIDEVLRGTNTVERIAASSGILEFLGSGKCLCFAATHDRELCRILDGKLDMYHFTEEIHEDNVTFPFLLKKGVSDRTNAIRLLDMLGFDNRIVESAQNRVEHYRKTGNWI